MRSIEELREICLEIFEICKKYNLNKSEVFLVLNALKHAFKNVYEVYESGKYKKGGDENERKS